MDIVYYEDRLTGRHEPFRFDRSGPTYVHVSGAGSYGPGAFKERFRPIPEQPVETAAVEAAFVPPHTPEPELGGLSHRELQKIAKKRGVSAGGTTDQLRARLTDGTET